MLPLISMQLLCILNVVCWLAAPPPPPPPLILAENQELRSPGSVLIAAPIASSALPSVALIHIQQTSLEVI